MCGRAKGFSTNLYEFYWIKINDQHLVFRGQQPERLEVTPTSFWLDMVDGFTKRSSHDFSYDFLPL
jgi:hypothetical protein